MLSVQVHPSDAHKALIPAGETAKTEAWVVLEAGANSRIYAGLKPGTCAADLRKALEGNALAAQLQGFVPTPGQGFFIPAGTVHSLGGDVVVFEIQQNSDVTFRLSDWGHVDARTGRPRPLQVEEALECVDFHPASPPGLVLAVVEQREPVLRERLFLCEYFELRRISGDSRFPVGAPGKLRVLVCLAGNLQIKYDGTPYNVRKGDVVMLPACLGACVCEPQQSVTLLEISIPEAAVLDAGA